MVQILIPSSKQLTNSKNGTFTVYCIEIYLSGKCHKVDRRYSEFNELHRTLKKYFNHLPTLPPKKVRNLSQKLIEHRRTSLEQYLKNLLKNIGLDKAQELNDFLNIPFNDTSANLNKKLDHRKSIFKSPYLSTNKQETDDFNFHQCMIGFKNDYMFSINYDLSSNYLLSNTNSISIFSDSSSNKSSNSETSCASYSSSSSSSTSSSLPDIVVMGALDAIYPTLSANRTII